MIKTSRGFSIAEAVIALSVIVTVSMTALTIIFSSVMTKNAAIGKTEAQNYAERAWECFKASDGLEEFEANMSFANDAALPEGELDGEGYTCYNYVSDENRFEAFIKIRYSEGEEGERSKIEIYVTDDDGDGIVSFTYEKGDG